MTPLDFAHKYLGQRVTAPGGLGGQCVDLTNVYIAELFDLKPVRANAVDWAKAPLKDMLWEKNGALNFPPVGSLVVWGEDPGVGTGINGHIAIALHADTNHLVTLDQDWPFGALTSLVLHSYVGVIGWHSPIFSAGHWRITWQMYDV